MNPTKDKTMNKDDKESKHWYIKFTRALMQQSENSKEAQLQTITELKNKLLTNTDNNAKIQSLDTETDNSLLKNEKNSENLKMQNYSFVYQLNEYNSLCSNVQETHVIPLNEYKTQVEQLKLLQQLQEVKYFAGTTEEINVVSKNDLNSGNQIQLQERKTNVMGENNLILPNKLHLNLEHKNQMNSSGVSQENKKTNVGVYQTMPSKLLETLHDFESLCASMGIDNTCVQKELEEGEIFWLHKIKKMFGKLGVDEPLIVANKVQIQKTEKAASKRKNITDTNPQVFKNLPGSSKEVIANDKNIFYKIDLPPTEQFPNEFSTSPKIASTMKVNPHIEMPCGNLNICPPKEIVFVHFPDINESPEDSLLPLKTFNKINNPQCSSTMEKPYIASYGARKNTPFKLNTFDQVDIPRFKIEQNLNTNGEILNQNIKQGKNGTGIRNSTYYRKTNKVKKIKEETQVGTKEENKIGIAKEEKMVFLKKGKKMTIRQMKSKISYADVATTRYKYLFK